MPVPVKTSVRMFTGAGRAYAQKVYALHVDACQHCREEPLSNTWYDTPSNKRIFRGPVDTLADKAHI